MATKRNTLIPTRGESHKKIIEGRLTCGDCIGLTREVLISGESVPCNKQGMKNVSKACPKFRPDCFQLRGAIEAEENVLSEFGAIMSTFDTNQIRIFGIVMMNEAITRKHGFNFYQRVYVRYRGTASSNYLSNFMTARILMADAEKVYICSDDGKIVLTYENTGVNGPSIYDAESFIPLRDMMIAKARKMDPDVHRATTKALRPKEADFDLKLNTNGIQGTITDITRVSKSNGGIGKRKRSSEIVDLVSIVQQIERGTGGTAKTEDGSVVLRPDRYKRKAGGVTELSDF